MKKIVLIDDNGDGSRQRYGGSLVDDGVYQDILINIDKINAESNMDFLQSAACILMHKTLRDYYDGQFHEDSQKVKNIIRFKYPEIGSNIPLVLFSDGDDLYDIGDYNPKSPNIIHSLSKKAFYNRLDDFVNYYRNTEKIELRILAYGKDFSTILAERLSTSLFTRLVGFDENDILPAVKIHCDEMRQFVELSQPGIGKSYNEILTRIQLFPTTVCEFKNQINNILENFQDYGKNYYCWK